MLFGPATITYATINLVPNGDFERWSSANSANNWSWGGATTSYTYENNSVFAGNYSLNATDLYSNTSTTYIYTDLYGSTDLNNFRGRNARLFAAVKGNNLSSSTFFAYSYTGNGSGFGYVFCSARNYANWTIISNNFAIGTDASQARVRFQPFQYDNKSDLTLIDQITLVLDPTDLGKTFGGIEIELDEILYFGSYTGQSYRHITGGRGIIHGFQWNNYINASSSKTDGLLASISRPYTRGSLEITGNNYWMFIENVQLFMPTTFRIGTYTQSPIDIPFVFSPHTYTDEIITIKP